MKTTKTLLIVDDSEADRFAYRRYLQRDANQQYDLSEVGSGEAALALALRQRFDVVLLDFLLPDMSGLEVLEALRVQQPTAAVIMLTAHGDERVAVRALKGGAQEYLVKDHLKQLTLQRTVRNAISQTELRQRLKKKEEQQKLIAQIAFQIRHSLELSTTLNTAVSEVRSLLQCDRVLAYQFAPDMSGQIIAESVGDRWCKTLGKTVEDTYFQQQGAEKYRQGRKQVVADIYSEGLDPCHVALLERFEVKAILAVPILMGAAQTERLSLIEHSLSEKDPLPSRHSNRLWGLMVAQQCSATRHWQPDEIRMLEALSIHCAIAIQHAELLATTQAALEKEKTLNRFKSQIIATVSHEYNSPLTAIQGAAALLQNHFDSLDRAVRENLIGIITRKSKHLSALVNDMLIVHRSDLNEIKIKPVPLNMGEFLSKLIADQQTTVKHRLLLRVRGNLKGFEGDRGLIQQIFSNLLSNAIKYSPEGGDVQIYLIGDETQIVCSIKDSGIGIPEADKARLFQPFSRGGNVGTITGTGLGLKIVKPALDLHNGTIEVSSQAGKGTRFKACLPKSASRSEKL